jgi:hypothetical protein
MFEAEISEGVGGVSQSAQWAVSINEWCGASLNDLTSLSPAVQRAVCVVQYHRKYDYTEPGDHKVQSLHRGCVPTSNFLHHADK